jgi:hypothetical protein
MSICEACLFLEQTVRTTSPSFLKTYWGVAATEYDNSLLYLALCRVKSVKEGNYIFCFLAVNPILILVICYMKSVKLHIAHEE